MACYIFDTDNDSRTMIDFNHLYSQIVDTKPTN